MVKFINNNVLVNKLFTNYAESVRMGSFFHPSHSEPPNKQAKWLSHLFYRAVHPPNVRPNLFSINKHVNRGLNLSVINLKIKKANPATRTILL